MELNLEKYYEQKKKLFTNADVFDINYYPKKPISREEVEPLFEKIADFLRLNIVNNVFVTGPHGSGKTLYAKHLFNQAKKLCAVKKLKTNTTYINCRDRQTPEMVLRHIIHDVFGYNKQSKDILNDFFTSMKQNLLIFLDEVDELVEPERLLYLFSRIKEISPNINYKISLIIISNKSNWDEELDNATRSSLNLFKLGFPPYKKNKIKDILTQRIAMGLDNPKIISENTLLTIVNKTKNNNSDLRIALKALILIIKEMEKHGLEKIADKRIIEIYANALLTIQAERVRNLKYNRFLILFSIMRGNKLSSKEIFRDAYKKVCNELKRKSLGYTSFTHHINSLSDQKLIRIIKDKEKNITFNRLELIIDKIIIGEEYKKRKMMLLRNK